MSNPGHDGHALETRREGRSAGSPNASRPPEPAARARRLPPLTGLGAAMLLAAAPLVWIPSARANPAYTADQVLDAFKTDLSANASPVLGRSRKICFESDPNCGAPAAATRFDLLVNFEFNSDQLTASARENLSQFAKALLDPRLKGQKFEIDGHTDASGAEDYNMGLSERRAKAVVAFLASQGVDAATLASKGFGKTKPRVPDPYSAENRRVETHLAE